MSKKNRHVYRLGIIGNCAYMAHINECSNVEWMCWPRFDSSFIFGSLLDKEKGGSFCIQPAFEKFSSKQYYITNTNVLCTEFKASEGSFRVTDFAPRFIQNDRYFNPLMLIRKVEPISGTSRICITCQPRSNYGEIQPSIILGSNHILYNISLDKLRLHTANFPLNYVLSGKAFYLNEPIYLVLSWQNTVEDSIIDMSERFLLKTIAYWQDWVRRASIPTFSQDNVIRSALALKLHQYYDTGAIIASGTTSLPESPDSGRNWDYRYCWLRDAYYTLAVFNNISHFEELEKFSKFIENIVIMANKRQDETGQNASKNRNGYRPVYSILGDSDIEEKTLHLSGYLKNQPVRIGNQASSHIQNDVYGQVLVSLLPLFADKRLSNRRNISPGLIYALLNNINFRMDEADAGLWEFRNISQKHCYTYLFHWAGSCAAIKMAKEIKDEKMLKLALHLQKESSNRIEKCYSSSVNAYTQAIGSKSLDASLLQLITMNYLDPASEKAQKHLVTLEKELKTENGLFFRYKHRDDFGEPESTFLVCAYWYVESLACTGRLDEAIELFEKLLGYSNHLGLLSEDVDYETGSQWGNFPQAYSHVGLMNAAFRISTKIDSPLFL